LKRSSRLTRSEDIYRVRQQGKAFVHDAIVLGVKLNQFDHNRIAIIAGRSVGGAVQRNLAKRRMRSAYQVVFPQLHQGYDLVFIARRPILDFAYAHLVKVFEELLDQAGLLKDQAS
jgi:ribonuclease P protein component